MDRQHIRRKLRSRGIRQNGKSGGIPFRNIRKNGTPLFRNVADSGLHQMKALDEEISNMCELSLYVNVLHI